MQIPTRIGIILDGNRRWAKAHNVSIIEGHREGVRNLKRIALYAFDQGVQYLTVYTFSNENWDRSKEQVTDLMQVFREALKDIAKEYQKEGVRIRFVGRFARFPEDIKDQIPETEKSTKSGVRGTLIMCLGYGGRQEIVDAIKSISLQNIAQDDIDEETVQKNMYAPDIPDPDIVIRTGGQKRLSGFLTWQSIYSELFFTDTLWPAFSPEELEKILEEFVKRQRNFGT